MFIERSAGRIRLARTLFLAGGLLPCALLALWAVQRSSSAHRASIQAEWQRSVGLSLDLGSVEHSRPGTVTARRCVVRTPAGQAVMEVPTVEVESAATEERLRLDVVRLDASAAAVLADVAREWLRSDARHPRNCVIEVADCAWSDAGVEAKSSDEPMQRPDAVPIRVECVAQGVSRAIRIVRRSEADDELREDELRMVRTVTSDHGAMGEEFSVELRCNDPVPLAILAACAGVPMESAAVAGRAALVSGTMTARCDASGWAGEGRGRITGIDLGACFAALQARGSGGATVDIERCEWRSGRLVSAVVRCLAGRGWVDAALVDRVVMALGGRSGPAVRVPGDPVRSFDAAGCALAVDASGVRVTALDGLHDGLAVAGGEVVLYPPPTPVAFDRMAWMLAPPSATFVPAGGGGAWLMSVAPQSARGGDAVPR